MWICLFDIMYHVPYGLQLRREIIRIKEFCMTDTAKIKQGIIGLSEISLLYKHA